MAGLDSFYDNNLDYAEHGSYSSLSTPGGRSSLRQRRVIEPFHSSSQTLTDDISDPTSRIDEHSRSGLQKEKYANDNTAEPNTGDHYANIALNTTGLIVENVICHPLIVLRRQCQVGGGDGVTLKTHLTPFSLIPVAIHLYQWQGLSAFYKGLSSTLTVKGLQLAAEDATTKFTPWPKELNSINGIYSARMIGQHLMLKAVSLGLTTPFFSASLIETVQSDIACEKPGILDVFKEGIARLVPYTGRLLPIWLLLPPTIAYGVAHYIIANLSAQISSHLMIFYKRFKEEKTGAISRPGSDLAGDAYREQVSSAVGSLIADATLYPLETVINRLHLQGSRTIIDNLDSGFEVVPVITRYEGFFDCCESIRSEEGFSGFYRGFGALVLQYTFRIAAIKTCTLLAKEIVKFINQTSVSSNDILIREYQRNNQDQLSRVNSNNVPANIQASGDYNSIPASQETSDSIQQSGFRNYIPASAFTDENDPYKHVRHAM